MARWELLCILWIMSGGLTFFIQLDHLLKGTVLGFPDHFIAQSSNHVTFSLYKNAEYIKLDLK